MSNKITSFMLKREADEKAFWKLKKKLEESGQYTKKIKNIDVIMIAVRYMLQNI